MVTVFHFFQADGSRKTIDHRYVQNLTFMYCNIFESSLSSSSFSPPFDYFHHPHQDSLQFYTGFIATFERKPRQSNNL